MLNEQLCETTYYTYYMQMVGYINFGSKLIFLFKYIDAHRCYMCSLKLWLYRVLKLLLKYVSHSTFVVVVYVCSCLSLLDGVV